MVNDLEATLLMAILVSPKVTFGELGTVYQDFMAAHGISRLAPYPKDDHEYATNSAMRTIHRLYRRGLLGGRKRIYLTQRAHWMLYEMAPLPREEA